MFQNFIKPLGFMACLAMVTLFTACEKEDSAADVENYVLQTMYEIEERSGTGLAGCYELVFPVTVQFPDSTTQEVFDYDELRQAIRDWYHSNDSRPRPFNRPHLQLPLDILTEDGEIITVSTPEELRELRLACVQDNFGPGHHGHFGKDRPCFRPVMPFTLSFPDGTQVEIDTPQELHQVLREWKQNNPGSQEHPVFAFPITVRLRDGSLITVNSADELRALKQACRG